MLLKLEVIDAVKACVETTFNKKTGEQEHEIDWHKIPKELWSRVTWIAKGQNLYAFNGLYYETVSIEQFRDDLNCSAGIYHCKEKNNEYSINKGNEVFTQLCDHVQITREINVEDVIPFQNGYLRLNGEWLEPGKYHMFKEFYITRVIPYDYDINAVCPGFKKMMQILLPDQKTREEVLKFFAYTMMSIRNNLRYHQVWWGEGNNGKTQLAEHWAALLGDMASNVPLNNILNDKHAMVGLRGKNLNVCSEIKGVMLNAISLDRAKGMTTDAYLTARDIYESQTKAQYPNTTRHLLTGNDLPYSEYMSDDKAFFSRWFLIHWLYSWCDADWVEWADPDGGTKHVFDKIFTKEASGILSYVTSFMGRINELQVDWEVTQENWVIAGNSAIAFLHNPGIEDEHDTAKRRLFEQYKQWCKVHKRETLTYQTFFKTLKNRGYREIRKQLTDGDGGYVYEAYIEALSYNADKEIMAWVGRQTELDVMIDRR